MQGRAKTVVAPECLREEKFPIQHGEDTVEVRLMCLPGSFPACEALVELAVDRRSVDEVVGGDKRKFTTEDLARLLTWARTPEGIARVVEDVWTMGWIHDVPTQTAAAIGAVVQAYVGTLKGGD
jgi:hypothetical protein